MLFGHGDFEVISLAVNIFYCSLQLVKMFKSPCTQDVLVPPQTHTGRVQEFGSFQEADFLCFVFLYVMTKQVVAVVCFLHQGDN